MLGCDNLQGFQLSRPLNRRQVMELVIGIEFHRSRAI
jgi:EAL domain-containing protein (putative c-di-GMP-specific phosphodiesterase class I)